MSFMRSILIYGLGSIGSVLAGYLSRKFDVYAVGREWHIGRIIENGSLEVNVLFKKQRFSIELKRATTNLDDLDVNKFDTIFITTKAYDLVNSLNDILKHGVYTDCFVLFQNGLGITETATDLLSDLEDVNIVRAVTYLAANITEPGKVNHAGLGETYLGGVYGKKRAEWARAISDALNSVGLPAKVLEDIRVVEYEKAIVNATINPITALLGIRNGKIIDSLELQGLVKNIIDEILEITDRLGIKLENAYSKVMEIIRLTRRNVSSMLQDVTRGRRTEIDFINGAIVKIGKQLGVKTPYNESIYKLVKAMERLKLGN